MFSASGGLFKAWKEQGLDFSHICSCLDSGNSTAGIILASSELPWNQEKGNADKWKCRTGFIWIFMEMTLFCRNAAPNNASYYQQTFFSSFLRGTVVQTGLDERLDVEEQQG